MRAPWARRLEGRTPAERRWFFARLGLATLAVVVLVIAPAYLASQPSFLSRYAGYEHAYDTWTESLHARVSCRSCHVEPGLVAQAGYSARMFGEFYLSIVRPAREPDVMARPTNEACSRCHAELRVVSPTGDLLIPHRAHVEMLGMECVECHDYLVHEVTADGVHTPPMSGCLTCHDGVTAKKECSACHTDKDQPASHEEPGWLVAHASSAPDDPECTTCHEWTEHWCADCHDVRPASHGEQWRAQHRAVVAASDRRNCEACHEGPFCVRCHGVVPLLNLDPTLRRAQ